MINIGLVFLEKAEESVAGAASEFANGRYNNCANRAYYACFQAGIAALMRAGIRPPGGSGQWSHSFVPAQFVGELINRRKLFPTSMRDTFERTYSLRETADYKNSQVTQTQAGRALQRAQALVEAVGARN